MKVIQVPEAARIEAFDGPSETISPKSYEDFMAPMFKNKLSIISCASMIEGMLEQKITGYFFGIGDSELRTDFVAQIVTSKWCTFDMKRSVVMHIIQKKELLVGSEKEEYEKLLRKVMALRNAFTHGTLSTDQRRVKLSWFESQPKEKFVTDEWLTEIEETFNRCFSIGMKLL